MEEQKIDLNALIKVESLPKITETLSVISDEIDTRIQKALELECTEDNKTIVKSHRAELNKIKSALEERRKVVKEQILAPYLAFEQVYNELVKDKLVKADEILKERISTIEITQREERIQKMLDFAKEYIVFYKLEDVLQAKSVLPNITLSKSEKSLKEEIKGEIERIATEIQMIRQEDNAEEVLSYYLENGYDYPKAKLEVLNRHQKMEELKNVVVDNTVEVLDSEAVVEEEITTPIELKEEDIIELIECEFKVLATKEQLVKIKDFLKELGVQYE